MIPARLSTAVDTGSLSTGAAAAGACGSAYEHPYSPCKYSPLSQIAHAPPILRQPAEGRGQDGDSCAASSNEISATGIQGKSWFCAHLFWCPLAQAQLAEERTPLAALVARGCALSLAGLLCIIFLLLLKAAAPLMHQPATRHIQSGRLQPSLHMQA